jgi:surface polysaccharide O-acyltransferase-like enzyme
MGKEFDGAWVEELDYLRGMAVIGIIAQHLSWSYNWTTDLSFFDICALYLGTSAYFAVPLFCVVSGFVLAHNYSSVNNLSLFYTKRARAVLPQFLIFSAFYVVLMVLNGQHLTLSQVIFRIITGSSAGHLWFVVVLVQFYLFFPIGIAAYNYMEVRNRSVSAVVLCLLVQISWQLARPLFDKFLSFLSADQIWTIERTLDRALLSLLFYFALGVYLQRRGRNFLNTVSSLNNSYLALSAFILSLLPFLSRLSEFKQFGWIRPPVPDFIFLAVIWPAFHVSAFIICYKIGKKLMKVKWGPGNLLEAFGIFSMGIYLIHPLFINFIQYSLAFLDIRTDTWIYYPILFMGTCLLSLIATLLLSRLPHSEFIIGFNVKRRALSGPAMN